MLLGFFVLFLIFEVSAENLEHKYTLGINPLALIGGGGTPSVTVVILNAEINFELKIKNKVSLDFNLTNLFFIIPIGVRLGVREYLGKEGFKGFYLHQGLGASFVYDEKNIIPPAITIPYLSIKGGYKYVSKGGFTVDPFFGLTLWSKKLILKSSGIEGISFIGLTDSSIILWPNIGLYLGYSW